MSMKEKRFRLAMKDTANWMPTGKVEYEIWAKEAPAGQEVYNHLEDADYTVKEGKNIVLSGTEGEQWVVSPEKLASSYVTPGKDSFKGLDNSGRNNGWTRIQSKAEEKPSLFAMQIPSDIKDFPVQTAWGTTLYANSSKSSGHGSGDYLVCEMTTDENGSPVPDFEDMRVINHDVFQRTYDASMFPKEKANRSAYDSKKAPEGYVTREGIVPTSAREIPETQDASMEDVAELVR